MTHRHLETIELLALHDRSLTPEQQRELVGCPTCADTLATLGALTEDLRQPEPRLSDIDLVPFVRAHRSREATARPRRRWVLAGTLAASLVAVVLARAPWNDTAWRAKGMSDTSTAAWTGVQIFVVTPDGDAHSANGSMGTEDALAFSYTNASAEPFAFLGIVAVDAKGAVRWYYPADEEATRVPLLIPIATGVRSEPLPDSVRHPLPHGTLRPYALFSHTPRSVREVEVALTEGQLATLGHAVELPSLRVAPKVK